MWFLVGPTAVGKTEIAIELARRLNAEIITADSMQVYRGMDIGTAKPTPDQQAKVRHHLLDMVDLHETYDVAKYRKQVFELIPEIEKRGQRALIVGGSGMYIRAVNRGLFEGGKRDPKIRAMWMSLGKKRGLTYLHHILERIDPISASKIAPTDTRRVVRALEHFELTGKPISSMKTQWGSGASTQNIVVGLNRPRESLYARCDSRVVEMFKKGFLEEVVKIRKDLESSPTAGQAVGYKEALAYLRGDISRAEMVDLIQRHTRQLAKRQLTWFKREHNLKWIIIKDDQTVSQVASQLESFYT